MKSFCIKTNNKSIIEYLLKNIEAIPLNDIYFINKHFKIYDNIIVHYKGENIDLFCNYLSDILSSTIINYYEPNLIKKIINYNYFYFDDFEKKIILNNCNDFIKEAQDDSLKFRKEELCINILNYITNNKTVVLDGFVNFRIPEYFDTLDYIVDFSVNKYVIEKEYTEFINILKLYVDSKPSNTRLVHLIYTNGESILLDDKKHVIPLSNDMFDAKYLSDISFSSNDFALNALLTLIPEKIEIHLITFEDEFINTLKLIFGTRISICTDCNICSTYKVLNNVR